MEKKKSIFYNPNFLDTMSERVRKDYFQALANDIAKMTPEEFWAFIERNSTKRGDRNGRH